MLCVALASYGWAVLVGCSLNLTVVGCVFLLAPYPCLGDIGNSTMSVHLQRPIEAVNVLWTLTLNSSLFSGPSTPTVT